MLYFARKCERVWRLGGKNVAVFVKICKVTVHVDRFYHEANVSNKCIGMSAITTQSRSVVLNNFRAITVRQVPRLREL